MLVKYRMLSNITIGQLTSDINGLIDGTITSVSGLSSGVDKTNSVISGTYPSGTYIKVNNSTNTFSKLHSADPATTHYFRLTYSASQMSNISLARSYTAGTDTLVDSAVYTANVAPNTYSTRAQFPSGINMVITNKCVYFSSLTSGRNFGIFDLGSNSITNIYTSNMKMAYIDLNARTWGLPYAYSLLGPSSGYSSITGNIAIITPRPIPEYNISNEAVIVENPTFISHTNQGFAAYGVYGLNTLALGVIASDFTYASTGVTRLAAPDYSIITE